MNHSATAKRLRPGTRKLWAQKLNADRRLCGLSIYDVAIWSPTINAGKSITLSMIRRYETSGPPTLRGALLIVRAIQEATLMKLGGIQLDLERAIQRTPSQP